MEKALVLLATYYGSYGLLVTAFILGMAFGTVGMVANCKKKKYNNYKNIFLEALLSRWFEKDYLAFSLSLIFLSFSAGTIVMSITVPLMYTKNKLKNKNIVFFYRYDTVLDLFKF